MRPTVPQLLSWQSIELGAAGEDLITQAADVQRSAGDLARVGADMQSVWMGEAADAAAAHLVRRRQEFDELAAVVHAIGQALITVAAALATAQRQLQAAVTAAAAAGAGVSDVGAVTAPVPPPVPGGLSGPDLDHAQQQHDEAAADGRREAAGLAALIAAALTAAGHADDAAVATLGGRKLPTIRPGPQPFFGLFGGWDIGGLLANLLPARVPRSADEVRAALQRPLPTDVASLDLLLQDARAAGLAPTEYSAALKAYWQAKALERAGIDNADWDVSLGVGRNHATVLKVYEYYKKLYELDPTLEWAGLANMVGPGFAAGFEDLGEMRALAAAIRSLPVQPPPGVLPPGLKQLAEASDDQLRFFESTFLKMQKDIFLDIGGMHEAYLSGPDGMANLQEMAAAGLIDPKTMSSWRQVADGKRTGSAELLRAGAVGLADHEQNQVIADDWDRMREHPPIGDAVTYLMTIVGKPSLPGTHFPGQVGPKSVPLTPDLPEKIPVPDTPNLPTIGPWDPPDLPDLPDLPDVPLPQERLELVTPLPDFNVSQREARFDYFLQDTMPAYDTLLTEPGRATLEREMARPLQERIAEQRALHRSPQVLEQFSPEHWRVRIDR